MNNTFKDKKLMKDITILDFKSLKVLLADHDDIMNWSYGEVTKPEKQALLSTCTRDQFQARSQVPA